MPSFAIFVLLPISFFINSIILFAGFALLSVPDKIGLYKKVIFKIWFFNLFSIYFGVIILYIMSEYQFWAWRNHVQVWLWYYEFFYFILYLIPSVLACCLIFQFGFKKTHLSRKKKFVLSVILAIFTSLYVHLHLYLEAFQFMFWNVPFFQYIHFASLGIRL